MKRKTKKEIRELTIMLRQREQILSSLGFKPEEIVKDPFVIKIKIRIKNCFDKKKIVRKHIVLGDGTTGGIVIVIVAGTLINVGIFACYQGFIK